MPNLLAVDLGASNGRVIKAEFNGNTLQLAEIYRFPNTPIVDENRTVWDFGGILQHVEDGIAKAIVQFDDVASIAVDSWAVDFGLIDSDGKLVLSPVHYRDESHPRAMHDALLRVRASELFQRTGIQLQPFNTLFQLYARLCENPRLSEQADQMLLIPDLITYYLCGTKATEFTNATTTQMISATTGTWDVVLLSQLGLPEHVFSRIVPPGSVAGLMMDKKQRTAGQPQGFSEIKVVHTASHDTASAVISVPSLSSRFAYISSGTWSLLGTEVPRPITSEKAQLYNFTNEGGVGNYRLLKNIMGLWILQEIEKGFREKGASYSTPDLLLQAEQAPPLRYLFNPNDARLLHPSDMAAAIRQICRETGQGIPEDTGSLVRSVLDSLALAYREALLELEDVTGWSFDAVHVVGGGCQNHLLNQLTANAMKRVVTAGPVEASAMGNALVQLLALGHVANRREMKELVLQSFQPMTYEPCDAAAWDAAYEQFQKISYTQTKGE